MKTIARCVIVLFLTLNLNAQPVAEAIFVEKGPKLDGMIDDNAWENCQAIKEFIQVEPDLGQPVTEKTIAYICYDRDNLYVGFRCYDDPAQITSKEMARDVSLGQDDHVIILLDTFLDRRNGYFFATGPRGSIGDAIISKNGAARNKQWDGLWDARSRIHEKGWDAEFALPFKTLNFDPRQDTWAIKLTRVIIRKAERAHWPVANRDTYQFQISDAGPLTGLSHLSQGIGLDIRPYAVGGIDQRHNLTSEVVRELGVDAFYQLTPSVQSALSVNTDFAQTEVDSRQINLTRFALHFPEKRDFFLQGAEFFTFGIEGETSNPYSRRLIPFFSRRIGLDNKGNPIPMLFGGKVTGRTGAWEMGIQAAADDPDQGQRNFGVARIRRSFGQQSSLGFIGTLGNAINRNDNYVLGLDMQLGSSTIMGSKNLSMMVFGLQAHEEGMDAKQAFGGEVVFPNDLISALAGFHQIDRNFRAGLGFVPRTDIRESYVQLGIAPRPGRWGILQLSNKISFDYLTNTDNELLTRELTWTPLNINFKSGETFALSTSARYERLQRDFRIFSQYLIPQHRYTFQRHSVEIGSAKRRDLWMSLEYEFGSFYNGKRQDIVLSGGYQVAVAFYMGLGVEQNRVQLPEGDFTAEVYRLNANVLISPRIVLYNYVQYDNASLRMGWQSRFRWILAPGNEILLVFNSLWNDPEHHLELSESASRLKLNYNYRF